MLLYIMLKYSKYEGFQTEAEKLEEEQNPSRNNNDQTNKLDDMGRDNDEVMTGGGKKRRKNKKTKRKTHKNKKRTRKNVGKEDFGTWKDGSSIFKDKKGFYIVQWNPKKNIEYKKYLNNWKPKPQKERLVLIKNKWNIKKSKKRTRRNRKRGGGQTLSTRRNANTSSTPEIVIGNPDNLPVAFADLQPTPNAIVSRNVPNTVQPQLTTYSDERILTVKILMDEMNFNDLEKDLRNLVKDALLNYVHHEDYSIYSVKQPRNVEDSYQTKRTYHNNELVDERRQFVPGELRIFLSEWEQSKMLHDKDENEAVLDLIQRLKTPADEDIKFYDLYDR